MKRAQLNQLFFVCVRGIVFIKQTAFLFYYNHAIVRRFVLFRYFYKFIISSHIFHHLSTRE